MCYSSTTLLTDGLGDVVNRYEYAPFGEAYRRVEAVENIYQYVGQWGVRAVQELEVNLPVCRTVGHLHCARTTGIYRVPTGPGKNESTLGKPGKIMGFCLSIKVGTLYINLPVFRHWGIRTFRICR